MGVSEFVRVGSYELLDDDGEAVVIWNGGPVFEVWNGEYSVLAVDADGYDFSEEGFADAIEGPVWEAMERIYDDLLNAPLPHLPPYITQYNQEYVFHFLRVHNTLAEMLGKPQHKTVPVPV